MKECKRCLLQETGQKDVYSDIQQYLQTLPADELVNQEEYSGRITNCINCDCLIAGMCVKCGCYVELRARLKNKDCPNENDKRW